MSLSMWHIEGIAARIVRFRYNPLEFVEGCLLLVNLRFRVCRNVGRHGFVWAGRVGATFSGWCVGKSYELVMTDATRDGLEPTQEIGASEIASGHDCPEPLLADPNTTQLAAYVKHEVAGKLRSHSCWRVSGT